MVTWSRSTPGELGPAQNVGRRPTLGASHIYHSRRQDHGSSLWIEHRRLTLVSALSTGAIQLPERTMIDFTFPPEHEALRDRVAAFVAGEVMPVEEQMSEGHECRN